MRPPAFRASFDPGSLIVDSFAGGEARGSRESRERPYRWKYARRPISTDPLKELMGRANSDRLCLECGGGIDGARADALRCSGECGIASKQKALVPTTIRTCKQCPRVFIRLGRYEGNAWHCSEACSRVSAKASRRMFHELRPERTGAYRERQRSKRLRDTAIERLWRRFPLMPRACEACGEARVLDIAHRPEHARKGAWSRLSNCTPEKIWVLCPLCHALLDRLGYTAKQLGIKARATVVQVPLFTANKRAGDTRK